jgi:hypothetical protein
VRIPDIYLHNKLNWINELKIGSNCYCGIIKYQISADHTLLYYGGGFSYNSHAYWEVSGDTWWFAPNAAGVTSASSTLINELKRNDINIIMLYYDPSSDPWPSALSKEAKKEATQRVENHNLNTANEGLSAMFPYALI